MNLAILGSTGSIGKSALQVVRDHPDDFRVISLSANSSLDLLVQQIVEFRPLKAAVGRADLAWELKSRLAALGLAEVEVLAGDQGLQELAADPQAETVLLSIVGAAGVRPAYAAARAGKRIALANKEALVAAGALVMAAARESGARILPVDSEHSAIFQCLSCGRPQEVRRIVLTASGGPFRTTPAQEMSHITPARALKHPNWDMGGKITIDSATLMNKGLEVIEAHWLFDGAPIDVVVHPQSIIHSMVEFMDGSIMAHLGVPDMRIPILYALTWPHRGPSADQSLHLNLLTCGPLTFEAPDMERFPCLALALQALRSGGFNPAVLNAANEVAVGAFLKGRTGFMDIPATVERVLEKCGSTAEPSDIEQIMEMDGLARVRAAEVLGL